MQKKVFVKMLYKQISISFLFQKYKMANILRKAKETKYDVENQNSLENSSKFVVHVVFFVFSIKFI